MKNLLHAVGVVLTILLLVMRHRCAYAGVCYKRMGFVHQCYRNEDSQKLKQFPSESLLMNVNREAYYGPPKYKRDPEIDVDNEQIGQMPVE